MRSKFNILVVEDSMTQAVALQDVLERQGWLVSLASNAESALVSLSERQPDLIVTDFLLPGVRGDELCRRLRQKLQTRAVPIVMLTAEGSGEVAGIDSGADLYVAKPFDADLLVARLRALLERGQANASTAELVPNADFKNSRILAIDDSLTYLEYLRVLLTDEGYLVDAVSSGEEGLALLEQTHYDCVLVDLVMPELSGIEVCQRVLSAQSTVEDPVVMLMLTAHETKEEVTRGLAAGADDFVSKNSDVAVLKARIRALLRRKLLQTENKRIIEKLKNRELEAVRARAEQEISNARAQMFERLEKTAADLKTSNDELDKAREIAVQASASKSEFLANMSHEIRTPINGVIGMTDLLLDLELNVKQRDYVETIKRSADSLLTIVNDILDFSKVEAGKLELEFIGFDFRRNLDDLLRTFRQTNRKAAVRIVADLDPKLPTVVTGDPNRLRQILTNLVNNALKFTDRGSVTLRVGTGGAAHGGLPSFRFEVTDTGIGISAERRDRLFRAFSQVDSSTSRRYGGTGLGLAISKRLVDLMGGQIGVDSVEGRGSTFWFELPLGLGGQLPGADAAAGTRADQAARLRGHRVLIAEDNLINQKVALLMMEKLGLRARAVGNGREVLDALATEIFDVILMDCHMPELDGYETTRAIREGDGPFRDLPIIAMTANAMAGEREKCLLAGMNDFVAKPVHLDVLAAKLASFLGGAAPEPARGPNRVQFATPSLDVAQLELTVSLDDGGFESWVGMFLKDTTERLGLIRAALAAGDHKGRHINAHALKSSCGYIGAPVMQRICEDLERADAAAAPALVEDLAAEFERVAAAIADYRPRRQGAA